MAGNNGRSGLLYGIGAALCLFVAVVVGVRLVPQAGVGGVDPVSAVIALAALAATLLSARRSARALKSTPPVAVEVAAWLAIEAQRRESQARTQLLGGHSRTIDVDFDFRPAPAHDALRAAPVGSLDDVVAYYQALHPRRLVITGAPGAGKTVLALELALGLLETRQPGDPVPVRLSAAAWDTGRPLRAWLARHLVEAYRLTRPAAEALLDAGLVLPVIDGLDEMDAGQTPGYTSRAARAIQALNAYQHGRRAAPLVLTCRNSQYHALRQVQVWARDAARVEIRAVDPVKAATFIRSRVDDPTRWQPVINTITNHDGGTLAVGLSTPWRLTLAVTVYEHRTPHTGDYLRDPDALNKLGATSPEAVRDHLLQHFIPAAIAAHQATANAPKAPYSGTQVHQWLRVLARYLDDNARTGRTLGGVPLSGTDLVLHQLWPLAGVNRIRYTVLAAFALTWLITTLVLLTHVEELSGRLVNVVGWVLLNTLAAYWSWSVLWTPPKRFNVQNLRAEISRRRLVRWLVLGLVLGLGFGLTYALAIASTLWPVARLAIGIAIGIGLGLVNGLRPGRSNGAAVEPRDPREIVKLVLMVGLAVAGVMGGLGFGFLTGLAFGPVWGLVFGLTYGTAVGLTYGLLGARYLAFLLCTRRPFMAQTLPWRLGRFLNWCYQAGLIRQAGISYQFRHRELQSYLAHSKPQSRPRPSRR